MASGSKFRIVFVFNFENSTAAAATARSTIRRLRELKAN